MEHSHRSLGRSRSAVHWWCLLPTVLGLFGSPLSAQEPPRPGEPVRIRLTDSAADRLRVTSPLEATFITRQGPDLVAETPFSGPVRLPVDEIEALEVERARSLGSAVAIGAGAGAALGLGMWQFLAVLCGAGCDSGDASTWGPAIASALLVGIFVGARASSGRRWVRTSFPE